MHSCTCWEWCFASIAYLKRYSTWFSQMLLINAWLTLEKFRSNHQRCSTTKGVLRNSYKIHRKTPVAEFLFRKVADLRQRYFIFKVKQIFSLNLLLVGFDFAVLCMYFLRHFCSAIMKLRIASFLHICTASSSGSHQIMWYSKTIHDHGLKITSCCCFFVFRKN